MYIVVYYKMFLYFAIELQNVLLNTFAKIKKIIVKYK